MWSTLPTIQFGQRNSEESTSGGDVDAMDVAWSSSKRMRFQAVHLEVNYDLDLLFSGESSSNHKNKQTVAATMDWQSQGSSSNDHIGSSASNGLEIDALITNSEASEPELQDIDYFGEDEEYKYNEDEEYNYNEDDEDYYDYDSELIETDYNSILAAKFDDLDLPPGVEAMVPWLQDSSSEGPSDYKPRAIIQDEIDSKFKLFKQFDIVQDFSDHHFAKKSAVKKPLKDWATRIQHEWKLLKNDLPESIHVRAYEERIDLLRAVIEGPVGTPYHDGLFFFDIRFPSNYPDSPPLVHYHSGGLRLNPNLYESGKVCLSLLNTWSGSGCEKWSKSNSTMLQVLVSIQALVLNENPYFNEPGYALQENTSHGKLKSLAYNEETFLLSCKTMLYSLRRPPMHFEDFVAGHFCKHGRAILVACRAYMDGARVGSIIQEGEEKEKLEISNRSEMSNTLPGKRFENFKASLKKLFENLLMEFSVKGANCKEFFAQEVVVDKQAAAGEP
ncbi:probable ubiquitin-conjugating enzyme E2 26 isoform X1 [Typha angustifolia]|uniref:probable ubiquitin-conjugating enzyme E2 26 isoform X1 n=2 Tax=Typha angustifolia TaxID=59011 RepID=UPI003C2B9D81